VFLDLLPSARVRDNVISALEALRKGAFDFYSVRVEGVPASYDGMVFHEVANSTSFPTAPHSTGAVKPPATPDQVQLTTTAQLLHALACIQAYHAEGRTMYVKEAAQNLLAFQSALYGPGSTPTQWEPLYLLALVRISRCAEVAHWPLPANILDVRGRPILQFQLLSIVQYAAADWLFADELRTLASLAEPAASSEEEMSDTFGSGEAAAGGVPADEEVVLTGAEKDWNDTLQKSDLAGDRQQLSAAAKELFQMVGLESVKAQVVSVYRNVAMDLRMHEASRTGCTLNFSFMGKCRRVSCNCY
jgi:hypothetical protein